MLVIAWLKCLHSSRLSLVNAFYDNLSFLDVTTVYRSMIVTDLVVMSRFAARYLCPNTICPVMNVLCNSLLFSFVNTLYTSNITVSVLRIPHIAAKYPCFKWFVHQLSILSSPAVNVFIINRQFKSHANTATASSNPCKKQCWCLIQKLVYFTGVCLFGLLRSYVHSIKMNVLVKISDISRSE